MSEHNERRDYEREQAARTEALNNQTHTEVLQDIFRAQWALMAAMATQVRTGENIDTVAFETLCDGIGHTARGYQHARQADKLARIDREFPIKVVS